MKRNKLNPNDEPRNSKLVSRQETIDCHGQFLSYVSPSRPINHMFNVFYDLGLQTAAASTAIAALSSRWLFHHHLPVNLSCLEFLVGKIDVFYG